MSPAARTEGVEVVAVASRSAQRAQDAAEQWAIPTWYSSYESLLASSEIDAVYVSTPTSLHRPWTVAAIEHGKHVLCEKPLAANAEDARRVASAAAGTGLVVMEAMHWRYHPMVEQMQAVLDSGRLGEITSAEASFLVPAKYIPRSDIRWNFSLAGGAMMDIGIYPASWLRWALGNETQVVTAVADCPVEAIDGRMTVDLIWETGVTGRIECSMVWPEDEMVATLLVTGRDGQMTARNLIAPHSGAEIAVEESGQVSTLKVSTDTTYEHQLRAFRDAVREDAPIPTSVDEALAMMTFIDACYRAAGLQPRPSHV